MRPSYEAMAEGMVAGSLKALERPEAAERMAAFVRRYYEALVKQGFAKEEALQIVSGGGVLPMPMGK